MPYLNPLRASNRRLNVPVKKCGFHRTFKNFFYVENALLKIDVLVLVWKTGEGWGRAWKN